MKKNRNIIIIVIVLVIVSIVLVLTQSRTTFKRALSDFAVDDTATVTKIFMADKNNNTLTLTRLPNRSWQVNNKYPGMRFNLDMLLQTMLDLQVKEPVAFAARNNIIRKLSVSSVKVEIYQWKYRINIFDWIRLFPHEKLTKVYYVGGATQSNRGTFMLMEGSSEPFVTFLPGLRGFLSPRYMPIEKYWRDYTIFSKNVHEIASVKVEFPGTPVLSYMIRNNHDHGFSLIALFNNQEIGRYDTLKVMNFMTSFSKIGFEALLNDIDKHHKDSILASTPYHIITVTDTNGVSTSVKTYHRAGNGEVDEKGDPLPYDRDRMFALVNNGQDFTAVQFLVFDPITRPITYFLKPPKKGK